jgi:hypothetical protein
MRKHIMFPKSTKIATTEPPSFAVYRDKNTFTFLSFLGLAVHLWHLNIEKNKVVIVWFEIR